MASEKKRLWALCQISSGQFTQNNQFFPANWKLEKVPISLVCKSITQISRMFLHAIYNIKIRICSNKKSKFLSKHDFLNVSVALEITLTNFEPC